MTDELDETTKRLIEEGRAILSGTAPPRPVVHLDHHEGHLYGAFAGAEFPSGEFDLGDGLTIQSTFAHFFSPFLMAFAPPPHPRAPHPAPWKSVSGGQGFDVAAELYIPQSFRPREWFDRLNTIWWIAAMLRLKVSPAIRVPVVTNLPLHAIREASDERPILSVEVAYG